MENEKESQSLDVLPGMVILWRHRYWLIVAALAGAVLAFVLTRFIDKIYESHAVLLPSNSNNRDEQLRNFSYGYEVHSERIMQLLASETLFDSLARRFDLVEYYGIEAEEKEIWGELSREMHDHIEFHKTRTASVVISVQDTDPVMAANLANESARLVNVISADIIAQNAKQTLESARREFEERYRSVHGTQDSILDLRTDNISLTRLRLESALNQHETRIGDLRNQLDQIRREYNVYDFAEQINTLNAELADARSVFLQSSGAMSVLDQSKNVPDSLRIRVSAELAGARQRVEYFEKQLAELISVNKRYLSLSDQLAEERHLQVERRSALAKLDDDLDPGITTPDLKLLEGDFNWDLIQLREFQKTYQRALTNYLDPVPVAFVVSPARPSYEHIYPRTFTSMLLGGLGCLLATTAVVLLRSRIREYSEGG